ncbi:hypothetical protein ONS95_010829 [Cadophora gregata]|uniref:uncharacterized protein n=1 Tax=Cadophora gregata TaxID=51156 RepID=UPI0026DCC9AC|nr:uncharacterized protein ONS95_010829 [Cadophora gregata]KAK0119378.1 hypothetical protein ONS95_010829 [Cadophora gregata]
MAGVGVKPHARGSSSSNPITLTDSSASAPSPPDANKIQPPSIANSHNKIAIPCNGQYLVNNDAPWQTRREHTSEIIQFVESLFKANPIMRMVAKKHGDFARKTARTIQRMIHSEMNQDPPIDWHFRAETLFHEIAVMTNIHPLVTCAFKLPLLVPAQDVYLDIYELRRELHAIFQNWIDEQSFHFRLLRRMLIWIHFARRELCAREMQHAVILSFSGYPHQEYPQLTFQELNWIGGGFIHFSDDRCKILIPENLRVSLRDYFRQYGEAFDTYRDMGMACLTYINRTLAMSDLCPDNESLDNRVRNFPLLPYAVENWHYNVPSAYMENAADYLYTDRIIACMMQIESKIRLQHLPDQNINQDLSQHFHWNTTRLSYAASIGNCALAAVFLYRNCPPNDNMSLQPPLVAAAMRGNLDVVQVLLTWGADVHFADFAGRTALHAAVFNGHIRIVDYLLSVRADVNCHTKDGMTPLMAAVCNGNIPLARTLFYCGAKVYLVAADGQTALSYALMKPELLDLAIEMILVEDTRQVWPSNQNADITLYEAFGELRDPVARTRLVACIQQLETTMRRRGSPEEQRAWDGSFVRKILDEITDENDLKATAASITRRRKSGGMIVPLSNNFRRRYMLNGRVGKGAFSSAWKAIDLGTGRLVAIKFLHCPKDAVTREDAFKESKFMSEAQHPNILKCLGSMTIHGDPVIVTEFAQGGDLWHYLDKGFSRGLLNEVARRMFREVMEGLAYLHSANVVHRDLKTMNILVFANNHVKIADFGNSIQIPAHHNGYVRHIPCTPTHIAPEAIRDDPTREKWILAKPCDIWSAGVCLYEMLAGKEPFNLQAGERDHSGLHRRIRSGDLKFDDDEVWAWREDLAMHLITRMMNFDPNKRPTAEQVLAHPWLTPNPARQRMLDMDGLRAPHAQKSKSFTSRRPEWLTPKPRTRRGDHSVSGQAEEEFNRAFSPDTPQQPGGSFSKQLEDFRKNEVDFSGSTPSEYLP